MRAWILAIAFALSMSGAASAQRENLRPPVDQDLEVRQRNNRTTIVALCINAEHSTTPHGSSNHHVFEVTSNGDAGQRIYITPLGMKLQHVNLGTLAGSFRAEEMHRSQIEMLRMAAIANVAVRAGVNVDGYILYFNVWWHTPC